MGGRRVRSRRVGTVAGHLGNYFRMIPSDMVGIHGTMVGHLGVKKGCFSENKQKSDYQ